MCNLYGSTHETGVRTYWRPNNELSPPWEGGVIGPRKPGPFVRRAKNAEGFLLGPDRELVIGRWGLIPWFSKTSDIKYSTNNARSEELTEKPSYKQPWLRGQRCIIPADWFNEPNWESGKNQWWRFRRADGAPWGLAGLWNTWADRETGEIHESYTMLTVNADDHPLMRRMHKPDPKVGPDEQDKRSVIAIEESDVEQWLRGSKNDAAALLRAPAMEVIDAGPVAA